MRAALAALALLAAPAYADEPDAARIAAAGVTSQALIDQGDAQGVFEIIPGAEVAARHPASGLVCRFNDNGAGAQIVIFPQLRRGENVACNQQSDSRAVTIYATRYPPPPTTLRDQIEIADDAILRRYADAAPHTQADAANTSLGVPALHVRYIVTWNNERTFTRASVAIVGDWVIKMRYSAYAEDDAEARAAESDATQIFLRTLQILEAPGNL